MTRWMLCLFYGCLVWLAPPAQADTQDDVIALMVAVRDAYLECDADALRDLAHPDWFGAFNAEGSLVTDTGHQDIETQCAAGYRVDYEFEILKIEFAGDWALAAFLAKPDVRAPDGTHIRTTLRTSWMLRKHEGQWKRYHVHVSQALDLTP